MELDDYLAQLRNDLQGSIDEVNRSLTDTFRTDSDNQIHYCPECGTRLEGDVNFCPNCGTRIGDTEDISEDTSYGIEDVYNEDIEDDVRQECSSCGILMTDIRVLAEKYGCTEYQVSNVFNKAIDQAKEFGFCWYLLNTDDYICDDLWIDYNQAISEFMAGNGIPLGISTPVFIIGGDDVIPIPRVKDPFGSSDDDSIPCDMCYAFSGDFFGDILSDGHGAVSEESVRNSVSRLPLEDGKMETSIEDDILCYFERCTDFYRDGIPVDGVMMTANASWLPASKTMSEHLPLVQHAKDEEMVFSDMYVSPPVAPDNDDSMKPVHKTLKQVDMLLFNLHGTDYEGMSGFYSDAGEAFNTEQLEKTEAKVLNTVACYGARYSGYSRDDSMLLTSFYSEGFLLYAGSLIPVPMTSLDVPEGVEVHEGSGSEHLMPIFCMEQYTGKPMGEAMMKAKLEYFNTFRHMERDDFSLATILMFSLYGNPMLRFRRNEDVLEASERMHVLPELPAQSKNKVLPICLKRTNCVWDKDNSSSSLLEEIRSSVNAGLDTIHQGIQKNLYEQLGLEPRWLRRIDEYEFTNRDGFLERGYIYSYIDKSRAFGNKFWVETDLTGDIKKKYATK